MPETLPLKFEAVIRVPAHTPKFPGTVTTGSGLIVMVKVDDGPVQLFKTGITVMLAVIGDEVLLTAVNAGMLPLPLAARPISGFELVQVISAPGGVLLNMLSGMVDP